MSITIEVGFHVVARLLGDQRDRLQFTSQDPSHVNPSESQRRCTYPRRGSSQCAMVFFRLIVTSHVASSAAATLPPGYPTSCLVIGDWHHQEIGACFVQPIKDPQLAPSTSLFGSISTDLV